MTFRKEPTTAPSEPTPAGDIGADETSAGNFQAPQLWNPRDRVTLNAPTGVNGAKVWQAVYRQPVETQAVSQPTEVQPKQKLQWVAGK